MKKQTHMQVISGSLWQRMRCLIVCICLLFIVIPIVSAQEIIPQSGELGSSACSFITGNFHFNCIPIYIGYLVKVLFAMAGGFALIEIVKSGFQIAMSGLPDGNKEAGKQRLRWALIGLAMCILSFVIVDYILSSLLLGP